VLENYRSLEYPDPPQPEQKPKGSSGFIRDVLEVILISSILFFSINSISARIRVESVSMQPTLFAGDFVVVNKLAYMFGSPRRGDVIVFQFPPNPAQDPYIKRIIGLPGENLRIEDGEVYIDGVRFLEPYLEVDTLQGGEWDIPEDAVFAMGDNRNNSSDSRSWGMVPYENIIGKALLIYWPPKAWDLLTDSYAVAAEP
jgi:signal peptidase I